MQQHFGVKLTEKFQRNVLAALLARCTQKERRKFNLMYPRGVSYLRLPWALTQVRNTLVKTGRDADFIPGELEIGVDDEARVIVNHSLVPIDEDGHGHFVFTPEQAREFAAQLLREADEAEQMAKEADGARTASSV